MTSPLLLLNSKQWEDLCDGCGRCCTVKLQDEETDKVHYTNVSCQFFDSRTCRCNDYSNRSAINPRCAVLTPDNLEVLEVMPYTCAYRLAHEKRELQLHNAEELKVVDKVISEEFIHEEQLPDHIIDWISTDSE